MNATDRPLRWLGLGATFGPELNPTARRRPFLRWLLPLLVLGGATLAAPAQYQFRTEVNADGTLTVYKTVEGCPTGALVIPETLDGRKVTSIGDGAFAFCTGLTNVMIPDTVIAIGDAAFPHCYGLRNVTIGNRVARIGSGAFSNCGGLASIELPDSITNIGGYAFRLCAFTNEIRIPAGMISIGDGAFAGCGLTSVIIHDNVTRIGAGSFLECYSLTNVTIGKRVHHIGTMAFFECIGLRGVTIPNSAASIGKGAFAFCHGLRSASFAGDAPSVVDENGQPTGERAFDSPTTVYYLPGTRGWASTFGGRPTAPWLRPQPTILGFGDRFGPTTNGFGFTISWATNVPVVVEASTDIVSPSWAPISTNTLTDGWVQFIDPEWSGLPGRFYRVRGP